MVLRSVDENEVALVWLAYCCPRLGFSAAERTSAPAFAGGYSFVVSHLLMMFSDVTWWSWKWKSSPFLCSHTEGQFNWWGKLVFGT